MPKVSILVPVYNVEQYIERCARSLFEQTLQDVEYIFVDDCSPDSSIKILEQVMKEYPERRVKIVHHKENRGLASARKTAYQQATGKYWICCDSDDWVEPTICQRMLEEAEKEEADIVCCGFIEESASPKDMSANNPIEDKSTILSKRSLNLLYGAQWNKLVRAELIKSNDIWPLDGINMWEDICVTIPLRLLSKKTIFLPDCLYHYRMNVDSISHNINMKRLTDMVKALQHLEAFFANRHMQTEASDFLNCLKLRIVDNLMFDFSLEKLQMLRKSISSFNVWKHDKWTLANKLKIWQLFHLPMSLFVCKHKMKSLIKTQH